MKKRALLLSMLFFGLLILSNIHNVNQDSQEREKSSTLRDISTSDSNGGGYLMNTSAIYSWIEINTTGTLLSISNYDDSYETLSFASNGWNFVFYGTSYSTISVSTNGWMSFTNFGYTGWLCNSIPYISVENIDCVALLCEDLDPSQNGEIYYKFMGSAPNRYLVLEYFRVSEYGSNDILGTFQVIFFETGDIKFQYKYVNDTVTPTIGLDHGDNLNYNDRTVNLPLSSEAISFSFDQMTGISSTYSLGIKGGDKFVYHILELDASLMYQYGDVYPEDFLGPNAAKNTYCAIELTQINQVPNIWVCSFDFWYWSENKGDLSGVSDSYVDFLLYRNATSLGFSVTPDRINGGVTPVFVICPEQTESYLKDIDWHTDVSVYNTKISYNMSSGSNNSTQIMNFDSEGMIESFKWETSTGDIILEVERTSIEDDEEDDEPLIPGYNIFLLLISTFLMSIVLMYKKFKLDHK